MDLTPASELLLRELSTLFARSFEGYFVTVPDAPLLFDARVRTEHISLEDSRVARVEGEPVGLVLMARRGRVSRVAGMGIVPAHRNRKLGGAMLRPLMEQARARGDRRMLWRSSSTHPGRSLAASAIVPEGLCDRFFLGAGFTSPALTQLELAHSLSLEPGAAGTPRRPADG
jgi:GNAT superfamily N-acetyltransferase